MITYKLYEKNTNPKHLERIADVVKQGGVIIYPTDSVYAIGCDALNQHAVEKLYQYRKRELKDGDVHLSIICRDISQAAEFVRIDDKQFKIMHKNLPGPFTFILEAGLKLPKVFRSRKTIGVRVPDNKILQALMEELDGPILTTSLKVDVDEDDDENSYYTDPFLIEETFQNQADVLIDGGEGKEFPSTVVDLTQDEFIILRQGVGDLEE